MIGYLKSKKAPTQSPMAARVAQKPITMNNTKLMLVDLFHIALAPPPLLSPIWTVLTKPWVLCTVVESMTVPHLHSRRSKFILEKAVCGIVFISLYTSDL